MKKSGNTVYGLHARKTRENPGQTGAIAQTIRSLTLLLLAVAITLPISGQLNAQDSSYRLNPGDILDVSVFREEELSRRVLVRPDGMISFPLAGHIEAAGKTAQEIEQILAQRMQRYISNPVITVSVAETAGNRIYVIGQVRQPGAISTAQPLTVLQALSLAGGLTPFGDADEIRIVRNDNGQQRTLHFDLSEVSQGRQLETNVVLRSGDVVIVPD